MAILAEKRVRVMPALRWQVFQRDIGDALLAGIQRQTTPCCTLITSSPRSLGGRDELANFQTLRQARNLGKGNRHAVSLRASANHFIAFCTLFSQPFIEDPP